MQISSSPGWDPIDILYVEDDVDLRDAACENLRAEGFHVAEAGDGAAALRYLREGHGPTLVILDLNMPGMDGFEFMARLRHDESLAQTPVAVVSGLVQSGMVASPHGAIPHLSKPFTMEALISYVRRLARRKPNSRLGG